MAFHFANALCFTYGSQVPPSCQHVTKSHCQWPHQWLAVALPLHTKCTIISRLLSRLPHPLVCPWLCAHESVSRKLNLAHIFVASSPVIEDAWHTQKEKMQQPIKVMLACNADGKLFFVLIVYYSVGSNRSTNAQYKEKYVTIGYRLRYAHISKQIFNTLCSTSQASKIIKLINIISNKLYYIWVKWPWGL